MTVTPVENGHQLQFLHSYVNAGVSRHCETQISFDDADHHPFACNALQLKPASGYLFAVSAAALCVTRRLKLACAR